MGQLPNLRWEAYAQARALQQLGVEDAYRAIGGKGNAKRQGRKLNNRREIQQRIRELLEERKERILQQDLYTTETVVLGLLDNIKKADKGAPIFYQGRPCKFEEEDEHGNMVERLAIRRDAMAVNRAYELLGIEKGMFPKTTHSIHEKADPLEGLTLDEILLELKTQIFNETGWTVDIVKLKEAISAGGDTRALGAGEESS